MDIEFIKAYEELQQDPQPVNLVLSKIDAWMLLTPIQIASKHPKGKNLPTIKKAVRIGKALQTLTVGDSSILNDVADSGWSNKAPKCSPQQLQSEFTYLKNGEVTISLSKYEVWCVILAGQLANRHQDYANTSLSRANKETFDQLESAIPNGILSTLLRSGWDTRLDQPIDRKGFGR